MDPANPVRPVNDHRLTQVQRWVISVLAVTTILHLAVGLDVAAYFLDEQAVGLPRRTVRDRGRLRRRRGGASGRLIHQKPIASWWLTLGLIPGLVGLVLVLFT